MLYTVLNTPPAKVTPAGSRYRNTYQEEINKKTGQLNLVKVGQTCVYDMIQLDAEQCKIENILKRVSMGDMSALQQRDATYIDATTMPHSLMETQNLVIRMKDEFYNMPLEVRKEFHNDPDVYVSLMGTNEFQEIMAPYNDKIAAIAKEKSDAEYQKKVKEGAKLNIDIEREMNTMKGVKADE